MFYIYTLSMRECYEKAWRDLMNDKQAQFIHMPMMTPDIAANELSEIIAEVKGIYDIHEFDDAVKELMLHYEANPKQIENNTFCPIEFRALGSHMRSSRFELFSYDLHSLMKEFDYQGYHANCTKLRGLFDDFRSDNWFHQAFDQSHPKMPMDSGIPQHQFTGWLNRMIRKGKKNGTKVFVIYEDLEGDVHRIETKYRMDIDMIVHEDDYIESIEKPKDHWVGTSVYDAFKIMYMWNTKRNKWAPVPLSLIKGVGTMNKITDDFAEDEDFGMGIDHEEPDGY